VSAIFGEVLTFGQEKGPESRLRVTGDENYAIYETLDGFTAVYDSDRGVFCYAMLVGGILVSGAFVAGPPAPGIAKHLRESVGVRSRRFEGRRLRARPLRLRTANDAALTFGPSQGLLEGRRLSIGAVRGLTLIVEFQDVRTIVTKQDVDDILNGQNYTRNGNICSVQEYFRIVSSGKLSYSSDVVGPLCLSQNRSYYLTHLLVKEAVALAVAAGTDLSRYDSKGEGLLDAVNIVYAGQTQYQGELWPHNSFIDLRYDGMACSRGLLPLLVATALSHARVLSGGNTLISFQLSTVCWSNGCGVHPRSEPGTQATAKAIVSLFAPSVRRQIAHADQSTSRETPDRCPASGRKSTN